MVVQTLQQRRIPRQGQLKTEELPYALQQTNTRCTSGTVFDLTVLPYSSYLDGECLRIVNMGGSTLTINGTASTDSIPPYRFGDVFRWNGGWYMER